MVLEVVTWEVPRPRCANSKKNSQNGKKNPFKSFLFSFWLKKPWHVAKFQHKKNTRTIVGALITMFIPNGGLYTRPFTNSIVSFNTMTCRKIGHGQNNLSRLMG